MTPYLCVLVAFVPVLLGRRGEGGWGVKVNWVWKRHNKQMIDDNTTLLAHKVTTKIRKKGKDSSATFSF